MTRIKMPKLGDSFKTHLLHEDVDGVEHESEVVIYVSDWDGFRLGSVELQGWDITSLLSDDEMSRIDSAMREHYQSHCEYCADIRDEYGDYLYEQRKDYIAESRGH